MKDVLYELLALGGRQLSHKQLLASGRALGSILWTCLPARRKLAIEAIQRHLGKDEKEATSIAKASFVNNCQSFLEIFWAHRFDPMFIEENVRVENPEVVRFINEAGKPVVATSAHLGAWELLGTGTDYLSKKDWEQLVVVRKPKDEAMHDVMTRLRERPNVSVLPHRNVIFSVMRLLKRKGLAAFLVDHNCMRDEAVFLPFLGRIAAVNAGPAMLAVKTGALVVPSFMVRLGDKYVLKTFAPLDPGTLKGSRADRIEHVARFYTEAVEEMVREYPEQWFWMHKRWKTRPENEELV